MLNEELAWRLTQDLEDQVIFSQMLSNQWLTTRQHYLYPTQGPLLGTVSQKT